jgi:hypothetical protein
VEQPCAATVVGVVYSSDNGKSLPGARVVVNHSSVGALTNARGRFVLNNLRCGNYEIVVSSLGYKTQKIAFRVHTQSFYTLRIVLVVQPLLLKEAIVLAYESVEWKRALEKFTREFLGTSLNAQNAKILNPEVLDFAITDTLISVSARAPISIDNHRLGYVLQYHVDSASMLLRAPYTVMYKWVLSFEEKRPRDTAEQLLWQQHREATYKGSFRHFLHALRRGSVRSEGFELYYIPNRSAYLAGLYKGRTVLDTLMIERGASAQELSIFLPPNVIVDYVRLARQKFEFSYAAFVRGTMMDGSVARSLLSLRRASEGLFINLMGNVDNGEHLTKMGYFGWQRIADEVPLEYSSAQEP